MVLVTQDSITYNGVALSDLDINKLRLFESEITEDIVIQNNALIFARTQKSNTIIKWLLNYIEMFEQQREWVQAEIRGRYAGMVV